MTVPAANIREAFSFFLGRKPSPENPPQFATLESLTQTIMQSPEFRQSERARKTPIGWPLSQVFVSHKSKVLYCPIGKNACTFMKRQMVRISDIPFTDYILPNIHVLTDHVRTGAQLSDYSEEKVAQVIHDPDYFKFALLRDPAQRMLSAYFEKFVVRRMDVNNQHHTAKVVWAVQSPKGFGAPDFDYGITFREFVTQVVGEAPLTLDAHWRPQHTYLEGIEWDCLYPLEQINKVIDVLEARSGVALPRQPDNDTGSGSGVSCEGAADLLPQALLAQPRCSYDSYFDEPLETAINDYFQRDLELIRQAREKEAD